ncbi:MAG: C39 family peptidase [Ruminiclostridium sp.]|nr:C39 family peptidase [Ruminiclostridium sp.]
MSQPVSYLQTDPRWGSLDYSAPGERTTIAASGCGPTAMAMVLATWADKSVNPKTECAWALAHGYKAPHSGTYYGYFGPAGARYGLQVTRLNWSSLYGKATSAYHAQVRDALDRGDLVIACMGKGLWTSSGHYVLVWKVEGDVVCINDPASTRSARTRGDWNLFRQQVKYYWVIEKPQGKEEAMEGHEIVEALTDREAYELLRKAQRHAQTLPEADWSQAEGWWQKAVGGEILSGGPEALAKRCEVAAILGRLGLL